MQSSVVVYVWDRERKDKLETKFTCTPLKNLIKAVASRHFVQESQGLNIT